MPRKIETPSQTPLFRILKLAITSYEKPIWPYNKPLILDIINLITDGIQYYEGF
jgi:hypothetical protein